MVVDERHFAPSAVRCHEPFTRDGVPLEEPAELGRGVVLIEHVVRIQERGHSHVRLDQRRPDQATQAGGDAVVCDELAHMAYVFGKAQPGTQRFAFDMHGGKQRCPLLSAAAF